MKKHVLLVAEDNMNDAMLLERALRRCSTTFQMVRVADGAECIEYVLGEGAFQDRRKYPPPEIVLLDLKMPRIDGFAVLRWRQDHGCKVPIIVFSSSSLAQDVERAYSLGANSFVVKPNAPDRLERLVQALNDWWAEFNMTAAPSSV